jgi:hypothetical protein
VAQARSEGDDWRLADGEARHRDHPRRFFIPPRDVREALTPGDVVRLLFVVNRPRPDGPDAERMWLKVIETGPRGYVGELGNRPLAIGDLAAGDLIAFEPRHVIAVRDASWDRYAELTAFVSRRLLEDDGLEPRFVVHDPDDAELPPHSDGTRASGWQLLVGDETDEELSEPANVRVPNLGWLMERYPPFAALVMSGAVDGAWCLSRAGSAYVRCDP